MRAGLDESVQLMEQREMNTNIEYVFQPSPPMPKANNMSKIRATDSSCQFATRRTPHRDREDSE